MYFFKLKLKHIYLENLFKTFIIFNLIVVYKSKLGLLNLQLGALSFIH